VAELRWLLYSRCWTRKCGKCSAWTTALNVQDISKKHATVDGLNVIHPTDAHVKKTPLIIR